MSKFVPYHAESVAAAREMVRGIMDPVEKYRVLTSFVEKVFGYDYIRAITIPKKNGLPDVDRCWKTKMGICMDISAMTVGMLRAVGLNAIMCIGKAGKQNHAWVETKIGGKIFRYDHRGKAESYKTERRY